MTTEMSESKKHSDTPKQPEWALPISEETELNPVLNPTTPKQPATEAGGSFGHFTLDGITTLCGRTVRRVVPNGHYSDGREARPVADCRNCNHKALGTRRTR